MIYLQTFLYVVRCLLILLSSFHCQRRNLTMGRKGKNKRLVYHHACMTNCGQSPPVTSDVADQPRTEATGRIDIDTHDRGHDAASRQLLTAVEMSRRHSAIPGVAAAAAAAAAADTVQRLLLPPMYQDAGDVLLLQAPAPNIASAATNLQEPRPCAPTNCCDRSWAGHCCRVYLCPGFPRKSKTKFVLLSTKILPLKNIVII